jgi:hypothetical protein
MYWSSHDRVALVNHLASRGRNTKTMMHCPKVAWLMQHFSAQLVGRPAPYILQRIVTKWLPFNDFRKLTDDQTAASINM